MVEGKASKNLLRGLLYLLPAIILLGIFTYYPLINTFIISFKEEYNYMTGEYSKWGFSNYAKILNIGEGNNNHPYYGYLLNTMIIVFISVPISLLLSLLISVGLNSIKPLQKVYQTIFFIPYVTNTIAIGMVFAIMFSSKESGLINMFIKMFGGKGVNWGVGGASSLDTLFQGMANKRFDNYYFTALVVLLVYIIWNSLPFKILILLSALQGIDKQYYQAAQLDGASKTRTFFKITVPLLSPQIFYLLITSFIGAFKEYTSIVAIFGENASTVGSLTNNMATVVWFIYRSVKAGDKMGYAAAGSVVLFIIIMFFTAINGWVSKKRVHY